MTRRSGVLLALVVLVLGLSGMVTSAYLTSEHPAPTTSAGTGSWCATPDPARHPNVYRLSDFGTASFGVLRMLIVPVVSNGEFGPVSTGTTTRQLGVRLWSCQAPASSATASVKVTAFRRDASDAFDPIYWLAPAAGQELSFAGQRVNPDAGFGATLKGWHREGTNPFTPTAPRIDDRVREQFSWIVSSGRSKTSPDALTSPCTAYFGCAILLNPAPTWSQAFRPEGGLLVPSTNGVTYWATKYWTGTGESAWPGTFAVPAATRVELEPYTGRTPPFTTFAGPDSVNGRQIQWVVMEWWSGTPTADMAVEVFVQ